MLNMGGGELFIVALVALLLIPNEKLPGLAQKLGRLMAQLQHGFRDLKSGLQTSLSDTKMLDDPPPDLPKISEPDKP